MNRESQSIFEDMPVIQAILKLAVPTVIGQIILVIYNMADTYFIGLTGSDAKITAVTVCMPAFMFLSAISNLFGVGGSATVSRALGRQRTGRAGNASAFALYGCLTVTLLYSLGAWLLIDPFVDLLGGTHALVHANAVEYLKITVVLGGLGTATAALLGHLVRAEGRSMHASIGIMMGGILNIVLDPLFMFVILPPGRETMGAAIATALSNAISCLYYVILLIWLRHRQTALTFRFDKNAMLEGTFREIIMTGLPACLMTLCENISYAVLDHLMAAEGMAFQAGIGVAKKINMLAHCIVRGIAQGVLPLIAYNYAARNYSRMKKVILHSSLLSVGLSFVTMVAFILFADNLVAVFINTTGDSLIFGAKFLQILAVGCPFSAFAYAIISFFQAIGQNFKSFCLAVLRKGSLDIPLMFVMNVIWPRFGIVSATPIADIICCTTAVYLFVTCLHQLKNTEIHTKLKPSGT